MEKPGCRGTRSALLYLMLLLRPLYKQVPCRKKWNVRKGQREMETLYLL